MDPNQALLDLLNAVKDCDLDAAQDASESLVGWLDCGGFTPPALETCIKEAHKVRGIRRK